MSIAERLMADPFALARSLAVRHNLICDDGTIVCWECRRVESLLPSLHCAKCLQDAWHRLGITEPRCWQREQTEDDKRQMAPQEKQEQSNGI